MFERKRRTVSRKTVVDADVEQVWGVLRDYNAMYWIVTGCVLALPVPGRPDGLGALTVCWQRWSDGSLKGGVNEVVEFEPHRLITFCERQRPHADSRVEFRLDPRGDRTHVQISFSESMYRYEFGKRGPGVSERYLRRLAEGLEVALAAEVPGAHAVETLVFQPDAAAAEMRHEIEIAASLDEIWRVNEDEDGSLLAGPELEKQWISEQDGRLIQVQLSRHSEGQLGCTFQLVLRPEPYRVIVRAASLEVEQQLLAQERGGLLRSVYRWNPNAISAAAITESAQRWLGAVKAAAEAGAGGPGQS